MRKKKGEYDISSRRDTTRQEEYVVECMWNMEKRDKNPVQWLSPSFVQKSLPPRLLSGIHIRWNSKKKGVGDLGTPACFNQVEMG